MGWLEGTFVQPKREYMYAEKRTHPEQHRIGKVGENWGGAGRVEKIHTR